MKLSTASWPGGGGNKSRLSLCRLSCVVADLTQCTGILDANSQRVALVEWPLHRIDIKA